jgi:hypothetical protein
MPLRAERQLLAATSVARFLHADALPGPTSTFLGLTPSTMALNCTIASYVPHSLHTLVRLSNLLRATTGYCIREPHPLQN